MRPRNFYPSGAQPAHPYPKTAPKTARRSGTAQRQPPSTRTDETNFDFHLFGTRQTDSVGRRLQERGNSQPTRLNLSTTPYRSCGERFEESKSSRELCLISLWVAQEPSKSWSWIGRRRPRRRS